MAHDDLMMVGSIAYDTAEEVFRAIAPRLGPHMPFMPDGEIGERRSWIEHLARRVFHGHPDIETLDRPLDADGVEEWRAGFDPPWRFRVRPGIAAVRFGEPGWRLGYARDAITSHFIFATLKRAGVIPAHMRFQICLPLTASGIRRFFPDPADHPRIEPAFTAALRAEVRTICDALPAGDIAIQWDCAIEDTVIEAALAAAGGETTAAVRAVAEELFRPAREVNADIPEAALVGYHACYGTATGWPVREPQDLTGVVLLLNHAVAASGRRVDFVHMPTVAARDAGYFAPLRDLAAGDARVYLGLIHALHDRDGMRRQMDWAGAILGDFGIAAPCGFGRGPGKMSAQTGLASPNAYMEGIIADHRAALDLRAAARG